VVQVILYAELSYIQMSTVFDDICTLITFATLVTIFAILVTVFAANFMYRMDPGIEYIYIYI